MTRPSGGREVVLLVRGGRCSCSPTRRVRWVDPPGVPGLLPMVHCRADGETGERSKRSHALPGPDEGVRAVVLGVYMPELSP